MSTETKKYLINAMLLMLLGAVSFIGGIVYHNSTIIEEKEIPILGIGA
jgi:hypothetical protein